ncbi:CesT family type III secretion system chaperone [Aeromonas hydrophila]|uniref:CesT family type III secretion system chaperone n=1 Tax=Aeromonas hydrophila TaxID=644 RepID=UPI0005EE83B2|nr:CesT family type III secretion system chaperone [Aeromonas hydrophila]QPR89106.1 CesT family type III secretion system chaperone [Aeromonas hydrophila]QWL76190.1 CesT family type III secretion system chaperone [Aeromonas hydrophila]UON54216.1 CesT family type III secretion system chaperone [Aeromonas hydrophila]
MDIYQKIVAELSVEPLAFDENGVCTFEIQRAAEESTAPFVVNIVAQPDEMALVLSVTTASDLPERLPRELFLRFGEHALSPLRHGYGVGIYPGTERVSFFSQIALGNYRPQQIRESLADLLEKAHEWEASLSQEGQTTHVTKSDMGAGQNIRV